MTRTDGTGPSVALVGLHLDPVVRSPDELLGGGRKNFGRASAAAQRAGVRMTMVQAAWEDAEREVEGVRCSFVRDPGRLRARVSALAPDVVHLEGLLPRGVRALAGALPAVPILAQDHATRCPQGWRRWWYRRAFAPLAGVAFADRAQAAPFLAAGVLRPGIRVFELLADSSWFTPGDQAAARRETGLFGDPCLLWLGRLDANKDPLTMLDAFARAIPALPDPHLWCCFGTPSPLEAAVVRRVAEDRALAARVHILGARPHADVEPLLRAADFFVQGSHHEAMGVAAIEALACGTTPLVTAIPSFERITAGGAVGGLARPGNAGSMTTQLVEWAQRDRTVLRRQARAHFERALSFDVIGAQLRAVYDTLRTPR